MDKKPLEVQRSNYMPTLREVAEQLNKNIEQTQGTIAFAVKTIVSRAEEYEKLIADIYTHREYLPSQLHEEIERIVSTSLQEDISFDMLKKQVGEIFLEAVDAVLKHKDLMTLEHYGALQNTTRFSDAVQKKLHA